LNNLGSGIDNGLTWKFDEFNTYVGYAQAYAAIAQAEQLKRIADIMEEDREIANTNRDAAVFAARMKYGR
jgi:hypothetical protein